MVKARKKLRPRDAITFEQVCKLRTDNKSVRSGWIILNSDKQIVLCNQRNGEEATGRVEFTRSEFNRLVDWYNGV
jgi:hypothetical protein